MTSRSGCGWRRTPEGRWEYWSERVIFADGVRQVHEPEIAWSATVAANGDVSIFKWGGNANGIYLEREVWEDLLKELLNGDQEWLAHAFLTERKRADHERTRWSRAFNDHLTERTRRQRIARSVERTIQRLRMLHEWLEQFGKLTGLKKSTALGCLETSINDMQGALTDDA